MPRNERGMTVLFLESSRNFGGQERRLVREAVRLAGMGHASLVACPRDAVLYDRSLAAGLPVFAVPMRGSVEPASLGILFRVIRRHRVDVIYSHSGKDSWLGGICGLLTGVPLVRSRELLTEVRHKSAYNLLPKRILACSEAVRKHLIERGVDERKVFVQYPPVDTSRFASVTPGERESARRELQLNGRRPVIVCVGEFREEKRQVDLVYAMNILRKRFPSALLLLVGRDAGMTGVRHAAEREGLLEQVRILGEREDVPAILSTADVYVFPSSVEPFGMGPVEAMAAGVPVVVTNVGGLPEIVVDGVHGLHVPPFSPERIADAVTRILAEDGLRQRMIEAGRDRARVFDAASAMHSLERHFRAVVSG